MDGENDKVKLDLPDLTQQLEREEETRTCLRSNEGRVLSWRVPQKLSKVSSSYTSMLP